MSNAKLIKPVISASFTALLAGLLTFVSTLAIIGFMPFAEPTVSWGRIWQSVWEYGLLRPCGGAILPLFDLSCRFTNLDAWLGYPPVSWRLTVLAGAPLIGTVVAWIVTYHRTSRMECFHTVRGNRLVYDTHARDSMRAKIRKTGRSLRDSIWLSPHVQLTPAVESGNIFVLGDQGSGKTGIIRGWVEQILGRGERALIHDAKGDMLECLPIREILLIAPHDARGWVWDIGKDVANAQDAREVSIKFIPGGTTGETVWGDGARAVLAAAIEALSLTKPENWGWAELFSFLFRSPAELRTDLAAINHPSAHLIDLDEQGVATRTTMSILLTLWVAALTTIRPMADVSENAAPSRRFSIREWLERGSTLPKTIVLQHAAEYPILSEALSGLFVDMLSGRMLSPSMSRRDRPWLHLILDELPILGRLVQLPKLLNVGREKGVFTIAAAQDWDQIEKIYGQNDASTLEARFKTKVACALGISTTRDRVVEHYGGKRTIAIWRHYGSQPHKTRHETEVDVVDGQLLSDHLGVFRRGRKTLVKAAIFGFGEIAVVDIPFTAWPIRRNAHEPADWVAKQRSTD